MTNHRRRPHDRYTGGARLFVDPGEPLLERPCRYCGAACFLAKSLALGVEKWNAKYSDEAPIEDNQVMVCGPCHPRWCADVQRHSREKQSKVALVCMDIRDGREPIIADWMRASESYAKQIRKAQELRRSGNSSRDDLA